MSISYGADLYTDFGGLARLRSGAREGTDASKRAVAEQIEALFIGMMLKSMRAGSGGDGLGGAAASGGMHRDLYDSQLAQHLARGGRLGFADMMLKEFGPAQENTAAPPNPPTQGYPVPERNMLLARRLWNQEHGSVSDASPPRAGGEPSLKPSGASAATNDGPGPTWRSPQQFVDALWPAAERAARELGTRPQAVLAVAALETGWGKHMPVRDDGSPSYNLFGIKAHGWDGGVTRTATLEFEHGAFTRRVEPFRSYDSPEQAMADFAHFVKTQPRYAGALGVAADPEAFLRGLHAAGYATDPRYGDKLVKILNSEPLRATQTAALGIPASG